MKYFYDIVVRKGKQAGPFEREDGKQITSLGEAIQLGEELLPEADEVVIIEKRVVKRLKGQGGNTLPFNRG